MDGYNIIFSWEDLNELSRVNMEGARSKLADLLCNYQGYRKCHVILVFDAYKVEGNHGRGREIPQHSHRLYERGGDGRPVH